MSGDEITKIMIAIEGIQRDIKNLMEDVQALKTAPVDSSRITFTPRQVIAIILFLASLNVTSGAATYYSLSNWLRPTQLEAKR